MTAPTTLSATSLAVTVAHAVTFLTRPLATCLSHSSFSALQTALEANLAAAFASTWAPHDPSRGSGRRVLTLTPGAAPPRPVYKACVAVGVEWAMWSALLSDGEFDLVVDPGLVYLRVPHQFNPPCCIPVWSANGHHLQYQQQLRDFLNNKSPAQTQQQQHLAARNSGVHTPQPISVVSLSVSAHHQASKKKTFAQCLAEDDAEDEEALFSLIAAEMREPAWKSPVAEAFPRSLTGPAVTAVTATSLTNPTPASFLFGHSRSSSRSSVTSAASTSSSFISDDALSSCGSLSSVSTSSTAFSDAGSTTTSTSLSIPSTRKGHARGTRCARVFIDTSRTEVTPYDGGKTTVLTGGVMLGAPPARNSHAASRTNVPRF